MKTSTLVKVVFGTLFILAVVGYGALIYDAQKQQREYTAAKEAQSRQVWLAQTKELLVTGKTSIVRFYSSEHTDELVKGLAGIPELKQLVFVLTDLSDVGMVDVGLFPNLTDLTIYGGRNPVTDVGLLHLQNCESLETLRLINVKVTDSGLSILESLPRLKELTLFQDRYSGILTDRSVRALSQLTTLSRLTIAGDWMTKEGIDELKHLLKDCEIVVRNDVNDDEW